MASQRDTDRAADLLEGALAEGELSQESSQALLAAGEVGAEVGMALGYPDTGNGDLLLATLLIDDSTSIGQVEDGTDAVMRGHNFCLEALEDDPGNEVLVHTRCFSSGGLSPYLGLSNAPRLSLENYQLRGATPLYRQSVLTFGAVMAKAREQQQRGRQVRAFTMVVTDGEDNASEPLTAAHVRVLVRDMLAFSDDYIVAGMGIGRRDRFEPIFRDMGIPGDWILTAPATAEEIRKLFRRIAKSLRLAASGDEGWLQLEAGPVPEDD